MPSPPAVLRTLAARFDPSAFDAPAGRARLRLEVTGEGTWDALAGGDGLRLEATEPGVRSDARLAADRATWERVAADVTGTHLTTSSSSGTGAMEEFRAGRLALRDDLHLGVGFLAATSGMTDPRRLEVARVPTAIGDIAVYRAGRGEPVVMLPGLGATKASFLPTIAALAGRFRVHAIDLPGFGDSVKPLRAAYDPAFFAGAVTAYLDACEIERAHLIGNSMGGRVALETGFLAPERTGRLALLAPSLAWVRERPWAPLVRALRPELGLLQPVPRRVVDELVRRFVPGGRDGWGAVGVDEFLRGFLSPRGRAAFYAALRNIYLEPPEGPDGFWPRLRELQSDSLFVWGKHDQLVPIGFARHVREALPAAAHLELDCGHVPQLERPRRTHAAVLEFLGRGELSAAGARARRAARG